MWAPTFDAIPVALEELVGRAAALTVFPFDVGNPLVGERFEERHDVLVEVRGIVAVPRESTREEQRVDPIFHVTFEERFDERAIHVGLVDVGFAAPHAHFRLDEVDHHACVRFTEIEHDVAGNPG
jgi:hypothetical protein